MDTLAEESTKINSQVSIPHLSLATLSIVMIILGLIGEDVLLNIAVSGPLIVIGISGLVLLFTIESRHNFSQKIDIKLGNLRGFETSKEANSNSIEILLFCTSLLLILLSISSLTTRNYTSFVISLFAGSSLLGIIGGRHLGSSVGISESSDSYGELNLQAKRDEYSVLKSWLKGEVRENLSVIQVKKIEQQKSLFINQIKQILSNFKETENLINSLQEMNVSSDNIEEKLTEKLFISVLRKSYNDWLDDIVKFAKQDRDIFVRNSVKSLLLLPVLYEILSSLSRPNGVRDSVLFNNLLSCSGRFAIQLGSLDLIQGGSENASSDVSIILRSPNDLFVKFMYFISIKSSMNSDYDFSPWWLLNLRSMLSIIDPSSLDEDIQSLNVYKRYVIENIEDWCYSLSEYFGGKFPLDETLLDTNKVIMQISKRGSGAFENDLIRLTWKAYLELR